MREDAVDLWITDYLSGKNSLLLAGSNEEAAALARMVREQLAERGRLGGPPMVTLSDGDQAGAGDLVRARLNTRIDADGQSLANRDMLRITGWRRRGGHPHRRGRPPDPRRQLVSAVPGASVLPHATRELGYAGNVFTPRAARSMPEYGLVTEAYDPGSGLRHGYPRAGTQRAIRGHRAAGSIRTARPDRLGRGRGSTPLTSIFSTAIPMRR